MGTKDSNVPTKPGWYWFKYKGVSVWEGAQPVVPMYVNKAFNGQLHTYSTVIVSSWFAVDSPILAEYGQWLGPCLLADAQLRQRVEARILVLKEHKTHFVTKKVNEYIQGQINELDRLLKGDEHDGGGDE